MYIAWNANTRHDPKEKTSKTYNYSTEIVVCGTKELNKSKEGSAQDCDVHGKRVKYFRGKDIIIKKHSWDEAWVAFST